MKLDEFDCWKIENMWRQKRSWICHD